MRTDYFKEGNEFGDLIIGEFFAVIDCSVLLISVETILMGKQTEHHLSHL